MGYMNPQMLDFYFPFFVFLYGILMVLTLHNPFLMRLAKERFTEPLLKQFVAHHLLGWACLVIGFLWSLQNLFLG